MYVGIIESTLSFHHYSFLLFYDTTQFVKKMPRYISIMGTMGAGKTTAARLLSKTFKYRLIEENFGENAFLSRFYDDMKRWAFHSQTFFLMEKISQMLETKRLLEKTPVIQDTPIEQDVYSYAKAQHVLGYIDDAEWNLYQKIYHSFTPYFSVPDAILFLDTSIASIAGRIESRGRGYEQKIPLSYLELLDMLNRKWLSEQKDIPVIRIDTNSLNIVRNEKAKKQFVSEVENRLSELRV